MMSAIVLVLVLSTAIADEGPTSTLKSENASIDSINKKDLPIVQKWSGDYPVAELHRLSAGQQATPVGYIGDAKSFAAVWRVFQPDETCPEVDFEKNIVVFSRNITFYNSLSIVKIVMENGGVEVLAMETLSARPVEDHVSMALAVISREGITSIRCGETTFPIEKAVSAGSPGEAPGGVLDATYRIENREVRLIGGRSETPAAPGSTSKITTKVFGDPVYGDLNGDGRDDAALFLVHDPGGSGIFYYIAAAIATNGISRGTNAVLMGDRVVPLTIYIRNGALIATFADRGPDQSLAAKPTIEKTICLIHKDGHLGAGKPGIAGD